MAHIPNTLEKLANKLLFKKGFLYDGTPKKRLSKKQRAFEKTIITTPMGNGR